jgi:Na+-driven multidrug efflux pump
MILTCTSSSIYIFKEAIIGVFHPTEKELELIYGCIWLISFNTFPDGFKGMLKGIIKALGVQWYIAFINIGGHWFINLTLQIYLGVYCGYGIYGLWIAKLVLEFYVVTSYYLLIYF